MERYPLSWPVGWKRTLSHQRRKAAFSRHETRNVTLSTGETIYRSETRALSVADALKRLLRELRLLGVREGDCVISTNIPVRLDGLPYSNSREPDDVGVAVYFKLKTADRVLACDAWTRTADNLAAIAQHIDALRRIDRYGVGTLEQAFAGYQALPAKGMTWRSTLGFAPEESVTREKIDAAFRERAREAHPDREGGSHDAMASLSAAKREAYEACQ